MKMSAYLLGAGIMLVSVHAAGVSTPPTLHALMKDVVAEQAQAVWDVVNSAQNDEGNIDPSKLKDAHWTQVASAAQKVKEAAETLAKADHVTVAAPGQKIQDEGTPGGFSAKAVQKTIDANPKAFAAFAQSFGMTMDGIISAAKSRNAKQLNDAASRLDAVCEQCHVQFWYPEQKKAR